MITASPVTSTADTKLTRAPDADADLVWDSVEIWMDPISFDTSQSDSEFCILCPENDDDSDGIDARHVTVLDIEVHAISPTREAPVSTTTTIHSSKRQQEGKPSSSSRDRKKKKLVATNDTTCKYQRALYVFHYSV